MCMLIEMRDDAETSNMRCTLLVCCTFQAHCSWHDLDASLLNLQVLSVCYCVLHVWSHLITSPRKRIRVSCEETRMWEWWMGCIKNGEFFFAPFSLLEQMQIHPTHIGLPPTNQSFLRPCRSAGGQGSMWQANLNWFGWVVVGNEEEKNQEHSVKQCTHCIYVNALHCSLCSCRGFS